MIKFHPGLTIIAFGSMALSALGCATQSGENRRLIEELGRAERFASDNQRRIAELEWRLRELDAEREAEARRGSSRQLAVVVDRLDTLLDQNRQLLQAATAGSDDSASICREGAPDDDADPKGQLRYWAERLRAGSHGFRGGLTPEQNSALNVLLKRERPLDPHNPWPEP